MTPPFTEIAPAMLTKGGAATRDDHDHVLTTGFTEP